MNRSEKQEKKNRRLFFCEGAAVAELRLPPECLAFSPGTAADAFYRKERERMVSFFDTSIRPKAEADYKTNTDTRKRFTFRPVVGTYTLEIRHSEDGVLSVFRQFHVERMKETLYEKRWAETWYRDTLLPPPRFFCCLRDLRVAAKRAKLSLFKLCRFDFFLSQNEVFFLCGGREVRVVRCRERQKRIPKVKEKQKTRQKSQKMASVCVEKQY